MRCSARVILLGCDPVVGDPARRRFRGAALAVPTAFFAFRLQGAYFAIGTWVVAEVMRLLVAQWKALGGGTGTSLPREATSEMSGVGIDPRAVRRAARRPRATSWPTGWRWSWSSPPSAASTGCCARGLGLALAAVRDNERRRDRWASMRGGSSGWSIWSPRSAPGSTGALIYLQTARISPDAAFSVTDWTAYVIFIVVIGGIGTIEGPILGVLVFFVLQSLLADYGSWYLMTLGLIAIAVMLFAPRGLWGLFSDRTGLHLFPGPPPRLAGHGASGRKLMADIATDVLIVGTGPAGSATAALLSSYRRGEHGRQPLPLARQYAARPHHQPAHDGGAARPRPRGRGRGLYVRRQQDLMGENVFCTSWRARRSAA